MKKDTEVKLLMQERRKGTSQQLAAARAGMSERTARKYEQAGQLPSHLKRRHTWATRANPFEEHWPWVIAQLERDPALQGSTLFALLCEQHPGCYRPTQIRTLQRHKFDDNWEYPVLIKGILLHLSLETCTQVYHETHIARWRAVHGPEQEVIFEQRHQPGERAQSDFTHMEDLGVTIAGEPFPPMVYHFVLTYSNAEAISLCFSETFEALAEGIEKALWQLGGVPEQHRTDHQFDENWEYPVLIKGILLHLSLETCTQVYHETHLSAAVRQLRKEEREDWTVRYQALMQHYGMQPTWNNTGVAHENGDVEQSHHRFKQAVDQALRARGCRDFSNRAAYEHFLQDLVYKRNQTRDARFTAEKEVLRPLPAAPLSPCKELRVTVSRFSTIHVGSNIYSVPSRLIGTTVMIRVRAETLEGYVGTSPVFILPRLVGKHKHRIDYHHIIWSLVRKPGAFAAYQYRDELFPTTTFRLAYDRLLTDWPKRSNQEYVRILHLAATTSESEVEMALCLLLEAGTLPTLLAVRDLVHLPTVPSIPQLHAPPLDLSPYDQLIPSRRTNG